MRIIIDEAENGFILEVLDEEDGTKLAFGGADEEDDLIEHGCNMLWDLIDRLGLRGGRYDRKRLRVMVEKGDKYEPKERDK